MCGVECVFCNATDLHIGLYRMFERKICGEFIGIGMCNGSGR